MRFAFLLLGCLAQPALCQVTGSEKSASFLAPLLTVGSTAEDRIRVDQLVGRSEPAGFLLRSPSSLAPAPDQQAPGRLRFQLIEPEFKAIQNSSFSYSTNDGALWAGRGWSTQLMAGVRLDAGRLAIVLAPQFLHSENRDVQILASTTEGRSTYASPWYFDDRSMDLPLRFGNQPMSRIDPGQSSITAHLGGGAFGAATENQWWGPGIRNAIVMSNNAAGFPHLFARTSRPIQTRLGAFEAKWILGGLTESLFFDAEPSNDLRSLSGAAITFTPSIVPELTVGGARTVMASVEEPAETLSHGLDVWTLWGRDEADQIASLFFRWLLPADGVEAYGEWSRVELPVSFRDFLVAPHHTQGYTLGLQWVKRRGSSGVVRLQAEATSLEMAPTYRHTETPTYYVGRSVSHGYTHRGRVLGAAIGPGSSSQWVAVDFLPEEWQIGLFGGRIRWETDTYYRQRTGVSFWAHDVSLFGGVRGSINHRYFASSVEVTFMRRFNYLFQNNRGGFGPDWRYDRSNLRFEMRLSPRYRPAA